MRIVRRGESKGLASILAMAYLAILTLFAAGFVACVNRTITSATVNERHLRCQYAAESGVEKAIAMLQTNPAYAGEKGAGLNDADATVAVEKTAEGYRVTSTAHLLADATIRCRVDADVAVAGAGKASVLRWEEVTRW